MNSLLFVEGNDDKKFIVSFLEYLKLDNIDVNDIGGTGKLKEALLEQEKNIIGGKFKKVGIIFDADDKGIDGQKEKINKVLSKLTYGIPKDFIITYIMNIDGKGELEDVLRKIPAQKPTIADCIGKCLLQKVDKKQLNKEWVYDYTKYDYEDGQTKWDFDNDILQGLKKFLMKL